MNVMRITAAGLALASSTPALAQPVIIASSGDNAWVLTAAMLILIGGIAGFAQRHDHPLKTGLALGITIAIGTLLFVAIGYTLAFSDGSAWLGGLDNALLSNMADLQPDTTISEAVYALFELAVALFVLMALVAPFATRVGLGWLAAFVTLWFLLVYVPVAHWLWAGGWLAEQGALDFGGGLVIQVTTGVGALVITLLLGRGDHDHEFALAGSGLVVLGGLGVIGGAALGASGDAAGAIVNVLVAVSAGFLTSLAFVGLRRGKLTADHAALGLVAGFASISAGAGFVGPVGAVALGAAGAITALVVGPLLKIGSGGKAFAGQACAGITGALLFPLFVPQTLGGPGYDEGTGMSALLLAQVIAVLVVALWSLVATAIAALMPGMVVPIRGGNHEKM